MIINRVMGGLSTIFGVKKLNLNVQLQLVMSYGRKWALRAYRAYWNTKHLGKAGAARQRAGLNCDPALLAHISPLGWAHILLTGEYRWRRQAKAKL